MSSHAFENKLRSPYEFLVTLCGLGFGTTILLAPQAMALDSTMGAIVAAPFYILAIRRALQGYKIHRFRKQLLTLKAYSIGVKEIPLSKNRCYLGKGFEWKPMHRQRYHLLTLPQNEKYLKKSALYRFIQKRAEQQSHGFYHWLAQQPYLPFQALPKTGGVPWVHGVGAGQETDVFIEEQNRNAHVVVFGRTRVGKTRLSSVLVNQDIRNDLPVLIIDPKGDLDLLQDVYSACAAAGRMDDLRVVHAGMPEISARYNPLAAFSDIGEVATRITSAIAAEGVGKQFADFAWQYLNITARCLLELKKPINYKTIAFYVKRPEVLLISYVDKVFPQYNPRYQAEIQRIIDDYESQTDNHGKPKPPMKRSTAIKVYLTNLIESGASSGKAEQWMDSVVVPLYSAAMLDKNYYDKITASVGPVLDKINQTSANTVFSIDENDKSGLPEVSLEDVIKRNQVVYIGLDALTNRAMADAVGQAVIADLVSLSGKLYKEVSDPSRILCLHTDEFSDTVGDNMITLLNKAGGSGIRVTAYTQTVNDLGAAFNNNDKAQKLLGNFGTIIMLPIANQATAKVLTECVGTTRVRHTLPSTSVQDRSAPVNGESFATSNADVVVEESTSLLTEDMLRKLPKGQAFMLTDGGRLFKIRIPLPKSNHWTLPTFETLLSEANLCFD